MDQATQQNAALVEQSAAAAESLKGQAQHLVGAVAVFKLAGGDQRMTAMPVAHMTQPKNAGASPERRGLASSSKVARLTPKPAQKTIPNDIEHKSAPAKTGTDDDWTSF